VSPQLLGRTAWQHAARIRISAAAKRSAALHLARTTSLAFQAWALYSCLAAERVSGSADRRESHPPKDERWVSDSRELCPPKVERWVWMHPHEHCAVVCICLP